MFCCCGGVEASLLCFSGSLGASFFGWALVDLAGIVDCLVVEAEALEDAVLGFFGAVVCLLTVGGTLVFLGGSFGIFFFSSGIVWIFAGGIYLSPCGW